MISLWRDIQYTGVPGARRSVKEASSSEFRSCPGQLELSAFSGACATGGYVGSSHQTTAQQFVGVGDSDEVVYDSNVSLGNHIINTRPAQLSKWRCDVLTPAESSYNANTKVDRYRYR